MDNRQTLIDFVEGRMAFDAFQALVHADDTFAQWIDRKAPTDWHCYTLATAENGWKPDELPYSIRFSIAKHAMRGGAACRVNIHDEMCRLAQLLWPDDGIQPDPRYEEAFKLLLEACPVCVDGPEVWRSGVLEGILAECPADWTHNKKVKHVKARITEAFGLQDKKKPRWIQAPNWPVMDGRPMKFVETIVKRKGEWHQHRFVDAVTKEERIIDDVD